MRRERGRHSSVTLLIGLCALSPFASPHRRAAQYDASLRVIIVVVVVVVIVVVVVVIAVVVVIVIVIVVVVILKLR